MTAVVLRGDARRLPLPDASVDLIVTSPPYFGLRSYTDDGAHYDGQIGSEATPAEWVAALVGCTAEWVRVLKPSGSIFVNLGDKYSTSMHSYNYRDPGTYTRKTPQPDGEWSRSGWHGKPNVQPAAQDPGMQPKSLMGLPWRYALACMDELGLILRRDIIWSKPNGLPESVTDRCRSSHEYLFHFTVQPRYYAAVDEIREPQAMTGGGDMARRAAVSSNGGRNHRDFGSAKGDYNPLGKLPGSVWSIPSQPLAVPAALGVDHFAAFPMELPRRCVLGWSPPGVCTACGEGRRPVAAQETYAAAIKAAREAAGLTRAELAERASCGSNNVWDYEVGGHLPRGQAWTNLANALGLTLSREQFVATYEHQDLSEPFDTERRRLAVDQGAAQWNIQRKRTTARKGSAEACACPEPDAPVRPALVVDPFSGTGTTALVASMYGRIGIGIDLSMDYARLAKWRTSDPAERAKALQVPKPPLVPDGQGSLFDEVEAS